MGSLRLFLACVVIIAHTSASGLLPLISGQHAIRIFFIISGFYMAMILSEKYNKEDRRKWLFYSNRALRIFPLFWIVLGLEIVASLTFHSLGMAPTDSPWMPAFQFLLDHEKRGIAVTYVTSQVSAIGVDLMFLFTITKDATLEFYNGPAGPGEFRGWKPYPMGHMWTISCELLFYAMAPFLNRLQKHWLVGLWLLTMGLALTSYRWLPPNTASIWTDFASPMQMGYFLGGMVAYHVLHPLVQHLPQWTQLALVIPFVTLMLGFTPASSISYAGSELLLYMLTILAIPVIFSRWGKLGWDRCLGNLSYPVYLVHVSVIRVGEHLGLRTALTTTAQGHLLFTAFCTIVSILLAVGLAYLVENRLDRWRQHRLQPLSPATSPG